MVKAFIYNAYKKYSPPLDVSPFCCFYTWNHGQYNLAFFWQEFAKKAFKLIKNIYVKVNDCIYIHPLQVSI